MKKSAKKQVRLMDLATVIRSKNSGPFELTLDVFFKTEEIYQKAKKRKTVNAALIKKIYRVRDDQIMDIIYFDRVRAAKATIARAISSGAALDTDVYGAQQHMPLVNALVPWE